MEFRNEYKRQFKLFNLDLIYWIIAVIAIAFFAFKTNFGDWNETIIVGLIALTPILLPLIIIHFNYLFKSHRLIVRFDNENGLITIDKAGKIYEVAKSDISEIIVCKGLSHRNDKKEQTTWNTLNTPIRLPWSDYGYVRIIFNNHRYINLTAFMIDLNDVPFGDYKTKFNLLPLIK